MISTRWDVSAAREEVTARGLTEMRCLVTCPQCHAQINVAAASVKKNLSKIARRHLKQCSMRDDADTQHASSPCADAKRKTLSSPSDDEVSKYRRIWGNIHTEGRVVELRRLAHALDIEVTEDDDVDALGVTVIRTAVQHKDDLSRIDVVLRRLESDEALGVEEAIDMIQSMRRH